MDFWGLHSIIVPFIAENYSTNILNSRHKICPKKTHWTHKILFGIKWKSDGRNKIKGRKTWHCLHICNATYFLRSHFIVCHFLYSQNKQCPSPLSMTFANNFFFSSWQIHWEKTFSTAAAVNFLLDWNRNLIIDRQKLIVYC